MYAGAIESTKIPRNALDVLAQHIVAMAAVATVAVDDIMAAGITLQANQRAAMNAGGTLSANGAN